MDYVNQVCSARQDVPGGDLRCFLGDGHDGDHWDNDWGLRWAEQAEEPVTARPVVAGPPLAAHEHAYSLAEGLSSVLASHGVTDPTVHWWVQHALQEAIPTVAKAKEYGTVELVEAGRLLASQLVGYQGQTVTDQEALELQVYQYVVGKLGRWTAAVRRGEQVSDDTLFDLGVYATLVQKARETGEWP
ncbi:hypothetical protein SEA_GHOBES_51 [Gordonia phage Ghobes]|uniref:Uncharacterized protein n=1 Tax=Gordonia phage Ghobes TaxID=1887647 RepID=A0A1B3B084_9CAUD|nr:hypothetical protein KCH37_gp51 [Gordonia phage Ghobes]AOE44402.1 hypothetical protein SEA_GHOBES_51 [Gordonia phage Ghobes]